MGMWWGRGIPLGEKLQPFFWYQIASSCFLEDIDPSLRKMPSHVVFVTIDPIITMSTTY